MYIDSLPVFANRFFEDYKKNENKVVVVDEIYGAEKAFEIINEAIVSLFVQYIYIYLFILYITHTMIIYVNLYRSNP